MPLPYWRTWRATIERRTVGLMKTVRSLKTRELRAVRPESGQGAAATRANSGEAMDARPRQSVRSAFVRETELRVPAALWVTDCWPEAVLADEIGPRYARADLVAGLGGPLTSRTMSGVGPLAESLDIAVLDFLVEPRESCDIRAWRPSLWRELQRDTLPALAEAGLLSYDDESDSWWAGVTVPLPFTQLVSVELKLRDAAKALAQASLHRLFTNQAFVAMPRARLGNGVVSEAARLGVGVLAVDAHEQVECLVPPVVCEPTDASEWRLASEVVLAHHQGVREGTFLAGSPGTPRRVVLATA